jgi:hypothetical protein
MFRCRTLNFKNFDLILLVKKYSVCCFIPSPVCVLDKFPHGERVFSPYGKNLSLCSKFNDIDAKHKQKSSILPVQELVKDKLFILWLEDLPHSKRLLPYGEKNLSACGNLSRTRPGLERSLHQMGRKSPDKQWNRQNSILFHETIPLLWRTLLEFFFCSPFFRK